MVECIKADGAEFICDLEPTSATILVLSKTESILASWPDPARPRWNLTGVLTSFCMLGMKMSTVKTLHHDLETQKRLAQEISGNLVEAVGEAVGSPLSPHSRGKVAEQLSAIMKHRRSEVTHASPLRGAALHGVVPMILTQPPDSPA